jgi:hypothetical protein
MQKFPLCSLPLPVSGRDGRAADEAAGRVIFDIVDRKYPTASRPRGSAVPSRVAARPVISRWTWGPSLDFRHRRCRGGSQTRPVVPRHHGPIRDRPLRRLTVRPLSPLDMGSIARFRGCRGERPLVPTPRSPYPGTTRRPSEPPLAPTQRPRPIISRWAWGASFDFEDVGANGRSPLRADGPLTGSWHDPPPGEPPLAFYSGPARSCPAGHGVHRSISRM